MRFAILFLFSFTFLFSADKTPAEKLLEERKYFDAKNLCEINIKSNPKDADSYAILSQIYTKSKFKNFDKAEELILKAIELNNKNSNYFLIHAFVLGAKVANDGVWTIISKGSDIKKSIFRAYELAPNDVKTNTSIFFFYLMTPTLIGGDEDEALKIANNFKKIDLYSAHILLGSFYSKKENDKSAIENYEIAISLNPEKPDAYRSLGWYYQRKKNFTEAKKQFLKLLKTEPNNPENYNQLASTCKELNNFDEAIKNYNTALSLEEENSNSIFGLAQTFESSKNYKKSIETFQWFVKLEKSGSRVDKAKKKISELNKLKVENGSN